MSVPEVFDIAIPSIALSKDDERMLKRRGVRYLGELFSVWFDPRSPISKKRGERIMAFVSRTFGIPVDADPIALGWKPCYWSDPSFLAELNVLVLGRCPTPPAPDWERYVALGPYRRSREGMNRFDYRGVARRIHAWGKRHFMGELIASCDAHIRGHKDHCPSGKRGLGDLDSLPRDLREVHSPLWAAARIPSDWTAPDWRGELWQKELAEIEREATLLGEMEKRQEEERESAERVRTEALAALRAERAQNPEKDSPNYRVDEWEFSVRTAGSLLGAGIKTFRQLAGMTERRMLLIKNFGRRSLNEVKTALADCGLRPGMTEAELDRITNKAIVENPNSERIP